MQHKTTPDPLRPGLVRALAFGLLMTQVIATAPAQTDATAPTDTTTSTTTDTSDTNSQDQIVKMGEYRVTGGFAGSLAEAAAIKQRMPTITEVIAAEDIGKLPDISIADALTRVTGIAAQRTNGRNQQISIRGLSGDFVTATLDGREQVSTGENRSVEFDQYPAELLNKVIIYKTASPSLVSQGLAGTVDMRTVQPLSSPKAAVVNGYYQWTQYGALTPGTKKGGQRETVSYIDQFDNGKVGVALGVAYSATPWAGKQFQAWGYPTYTDGSYTMGGTKSYVRTSELDRTGYMAVLEFQPNENIHSSVDLFYSKFKEKQLLRGMEIPMAVWGDAHISPGYTVTNGLMTNYTITNVHPVVRNDTFQRDDAPLSLGWNLQMGRQSAWPITFDAGYSKVARTDVNLETWSGLSFNKDPNGPSDTMTVHLIPGQIPVIHSTLDYADGSILKITDPQGWQTWYAPIAATSASGYIKYLKAKDELGQLQLSTQHKLERGPFGKIETGISYTERYKRAGEGPTGFPVNANGQKTAPLPAQVGTTDMSFLGLGRIYAYDPMAAYQGGAWKFVPNDNYDYVALRYDIDEKVRQFYTQGDIDTHLGSIPVTGDVGFRLINVDQSSKGYSRNGSTNQLNKVSAGAKYTDFAPSLNLNFEVAPETYLRFSVARQLARPRMIDMRAGQSYGFDPTKANSTDLTQSPWSGGGGNPKLRPWKANSLDLSLEKYFSDNRGYIAVAGFYKKLVSYVYNQTILNDFTGYPTGGITPVLHQGPVTGPQNGNNGSIRGLEFTWSVPSELFSKHIRGFGLVLNGAYTDSSVEPWGPGNGTAPIAGLSRKVANVTFYYERHGFSARVSERYRSANRQYITTFGPPNLTGDSSPGSGFTMAQPEKVVDAQVSYSFQHGPLENLTIYLQGYNLNDEPLVTYNNGDPRQVINYQKYGASYSVGASYKF